MTLCVKLARPDHKPHLPCLILPIAWFVRGTRRLRWPSGAAAECEQQHRLQRSPTFDAGGRMSKRVAEVTEGWQHAHTVAYCCSCWYQWVWPLGTAVAAVPASCKAVHGSGVKEVEGWQGAVSLCSVLLLLSYCDQLVWLLVVSYKEATLVLRYKQAGVHVANGMSGWERAVE